MYRAVTLKAMRQGLDPMDEESVAKLVRSTQLHFVRSEEGLRIYCDGDDVSEEIRLPEVSAAIAPIADNMAVRQRLVALQQELGKDGGVVMEGRDIGTVVFPDAELKIYLDADPKVRAHRRFRELRGKGREATYEETLRALIQRDNRDRSREVGGLRIADDARVLDTTYLTQEQVIDRIVRMVQEY